MTMNENDKQAEPVATDWERIARVQDAKLRAMCGEPGGFEKLCEVMDRYEKAQPVQPAVAKGEAVVPDREYTEQLICALEDNGDPVSIDAAEEFRRLLTTKPAVAQGELVGEVVNGVLVRSSIPEGYTGLLYTKSTSNVVGNERLLYQIQFLDELDRAAIAAAEAEKAKRGGL